MPTPRIWKDDAERKRAYRLRKKQEAAARAAEPAVVNPEPPEPPEPTPAAPDPVIAATLDAMEANPNRVVLEQIRDHATLDSDRIRAISELSKLEALEVGQRTTGSELRDLRAIIEALPVGERLPYLKGELDEHRAAKAAEKEDA